MSAERSPEPTTKPNGPVAAALLAAGIGVFVLGLFTTLAEASKGIADALNFSKNYGLGSGVGPLSGKVTLAVATYLVAWLVLHRPWRGTEVAFQPTWVATLILVALGFPLTFPPFFDLFAGD